MSHFTFSSVPFQGSVTTNFSVLPHCRPQTIELRAEQSHGSGLPSCPMSSSLNQKDLLNRMKSYCEQQSNLHEKADSCKPITRVEESSVDLIFPRRTRLASDEYLKVSACIHSIYLPYFCPSILEQCPTLQWIRKVFREAVARKSWTEKWQATIVGGR